MTQYGFKIIDMPDQPADSPQFRWRKINPFDWTIEHHPNCPIDGTPFEVIASLVSLSSDEQIRVGCCPQCGLVGYIDRPAEADIDRYYAESWMGQTVEEATAIAESVAMSAPHDAKVRSLPADRSLPVLEIGCGYGRTIHALRKAGFTDIDATEHCPARAEAVRRVFSVNVSTEIPQRRYGLIVSHHVIEHCVQPAGLILACAERQESGDWMWHTVPRFGGEPSMGVLFFLPHLWSFTSLGPMLASVGYDDQCGRSYGGLNSIAQKAGGRGTDTMPPDRVLMATWKLASGLGLIPARSQLIWQKDFDGAVWKPEQYATREQQVNFPRSITVEPVTNFRTDAPIEIQFPGPHVEMFVK